MQCGPSGPQRHAPGRRCRAYASDTGDARAGVRLVQRSMRQVAVSRICFLAALLGLGCGQSAGANADTAQTTTGGDQSGVGANGGASSNAPQSGAGGSAAGSAGSVAQAGTGNSASGAASGGAAASSGGSGSSSGGVAGSDVIVTIKNGDFWPRQRRQSHRSPRRRPDSGWRHLVLDWRGQVRQLRRLQGGELLTPPRIFRTGSSSTPSSRASRRPSWPPLTASSSDPGHLQREHEKVRDVAALGGAKLRHGRGRRVHQ